MTVSSELTYPIRIRGRPGTTPQPKAGMQALSELPGIQTGPLGLTKNMALRRDSARADLSVRTCPLSKIGKHP